MIKEIKEYLLQNNHSILHLNLSILTLTKDKIKELNLNLKTLTNELKNLQKTSINSLFINDLNSL